MTSISSIDILIGVVSVLATIVGALGMFLLKRLEKGNDLLVKIDKNVAVLNTKVDHNEASILRIDNEKEKTEITVLQIRSQIDSIKRDLNILKYGTDD